MDIVPIINKYLNVFDDHHIDNTFRPGQKLINTKHLHVKCFKQ